ncbi:MAG: hypothetical protein RL282_874 [Bacteroidota bacterium]|jgi:mRNA-degrading endonuclease RelE of RelBE toxin-antitoxin system
MSYKFYPTVLFIAEAKKLKKRYPNLADDLRLLRKRLHEDPLSGNDSLGARCYKVRMELTDKKSGKSGGARLIIQVFVKEKVVHLLTIYDKSRKSGLFEGELDKILKTQLLKWGENRKD